MPDFGGQLVSTGGTNKRHSHRGAADRLAMGEQILAARNVGKTMPMAARELGISLATAERYLRLALEARIPPTVDEFRRQQNDRLDLTQREIETQMEIAQSLGRRALESESPVGLLVQASQIRAQALALQLRLDDRRARLNGLDAPIKVDATITEISEADRELAELLAEAQAKAANEEVLRG